MLPQSLCLSLESDFLVKQFLEEWCGNGHGMLWNWGENPWEEKPNSLPFSVILNQGGWTCNGLRRNPTCSLLRSICSRVCLTVISGRETVSQLLLHWDVFESQFPCSLQSDNVHYQFWQYSVRAGIKKKIYTASEEQQDPLFFIFKTQKMSAYILMALHSWFLPYHFL